MTSMPVQKPGKSKQDYGTPDDFLDAVLDYLGISAFDYDLACSRGTRIRPAARGLDFSRVNALTVAWPVGAWHWLNPPFKRIGQWAVKCYAHSKQGGKVALLVPAGVGSNWWAEYVHDKAFVLFPSPRLTFKGCTDPYPKDVALILYGYGKVGYDTWRWK